MKLPFGLTSQQIRVLQEFRRKTTEELTPDEVNGITHPAGGGGEAPARALVEAGFLTSTGDVYQLTDRARELLARPAEPETSEAGATEG